MDINTVRNSREIRKLTVQEVRGP